MPVRSLLTTSQPIANLAHSPKDGRTTVFVQKRRSDTGRRLSHLVSKFEILDSLSRQGKPMLAKKANLPGGNESTLQLNRPSSSHSSASARSLYHQAPGDKPGNALPGQEETPEDDEAGAGEARVSLVAERRRLFEVNLGEASLNARTLDAHASYSRPLQRVPLLSTWQTLRVRSPSPCMAQSQTAVLSRPSIANTSLSKRLAGYLPLSSTCPSLPHVQIGTQPHTLSDCVQSCMQDGRLVEDWTLDVTPGPCASSPTTDKGKEAQTQPTSEAEHEHEHEHQHQHNHEPERELVAGKDQETPPAGAGAGETLMPPRRFDNDEFTAKNRRSTSTVDETAHQHHHGAAAIRMSKASASATRSTDIGSMSMHTNSCGTKMDDDDDGGGRGSGRSNKRDATNMSFACAHDGSDSSCIAAARLSNGKHIEAVAAHYFEADSRKSLNPPRISNTIEHFEALSSGDKLDGKFKSSIRLPKRLTGSSSHHLSKPEGKPIMSPAESARRKFSNSWGPARFRKSRVPCGSDARPSGSNANSNSNSNSKHSYEPLYKRPNNQAPTDGNVEKSRPAPAPAPASEHWLSRFHPNHNNKKINTSHVAQVQTFKTRSVTGARLRPKGPRPQPTKMTAGNERTLPSADQLATRTDMHADDDHDHGHGHGSWRPRRRWVSRSSIPLVAQADCALQQPKPIRMNEVRRLVSLCRDKMTARKHRAQTY
ncbi:hypothetical protein E4U21_003907 [Claviceps maximensis]|nr:hypothetical protein E4U21_003907 [Claviceps maximensis]